MELFSIKICAILKELTEFWQNLYILFIDKGICGIVRCNVLKIAIVLLLLRDCFSRIIPNYVLVEIKFQDS